MCKSVLNLCLQFWRSTHVCHVLNSACVLILSCADLTHAFVLFKHAELECVVSKHNDRHTWYSVALYIGGSPKFC